jgi:uncharacterized membrane protein YedE/YeeE
VIELGPSSVALALAGGALIGLAAAMLYLLVGRIAGVSGIVGGLLPPASGDTRWRVAFVLGLLAGPLLAVLLTGRSGVGAPAAPLPVLIVAGLLVGVGTALGGGCTSGHGVCGIARLSPRSLAATGIFIAVAVATVFVVRHAV